MMILALIGLILLVAGLVILFFVQIIFALYIVVQGAIALCETHLGGVIDE